MRAVLLTGFGGPEVLRVSQAEEPVASEGRVLIRVVATSVNRPDIVQRQGHYPPPQGESDILGLEVAGTIEALGPGVTRFAVGERVMALVAGGGYAEHASAWAGHVMRIPARLTFEQAACVCETYITAYLNVFMNAGLADGELLLVHGGGGGVGTAAVQLCKVLAPSSTIAATASAQKIERLRAMGADLVIDYRAEDFADAVLRHSAGRGADVILDHVGAAYLAANLKALGVGGRLLVIGVMGGRKAELDLAALLVKRQRIIGSVLRTRPTDEKAAIIAEFERRVVPLLAEGRIAPVIHAVYPLSSVAEAHGVMEESRHFGKLVLRVAEGDAA